MNLRVVQALAAREARTVADGAGGAIVAWIEGGDVFAQRIAANGTLLWGPSGVSLCTAIGDQSHVRITGDGGGGAIAAWQDARASETARAVFAQRVDAAGALRWSENGVRVATSPDSDYEPDLAADGSGGTVIAWTREQNLGGEALRKAFAQRLGANGALSWNASGVELTNRGTGQGEALAVVSDAAGGAIVVTLDHDPSATHYTTIRAARVLAAGTPAWSKVVRGGGGIYYGANAQAAIPDGAGGTFLAWQDYRIATAGADVYVQHVDANGAMLWTTGGVRLCNVSQDQTAPAVAAAANGDVIVVWNDARNGGDVYGQSVSAAGIPQWSTNGVPICSAPGNQTGCAIAADGAGGAHVVWSDERSGGADVYGQRVTGSGSPMWPQNGIALCTETGAQTEPRVVATPSGGAITAWLDARTELSTIHAMHVTPTGLLGWPAGGVRVHLPAGNQRAHQAVSDGAGGVIVVWEDLREGTSDLYAQRVSVTGALQWASHGVVLCTAPGDQMAPQLVPDGAGGAILAWAHARGGAFDVFVQRLDAAGTPRWGTDGLALCTAAGDQHSIQLVADDAGGACVVWVDERTGDADIYAQRLAATGAALWQTGGVPLCTAPGAQRAPQLASDGASGAVVVWEDLRLAATPDVYAARVDASGALPWNPGGVVLCDEIGAQQAVQIVATSGGGALVVWEDNRNLGQADVYALVVDGNGTRLGQANGTPLCQHPANQLAPRVVPDGSSGAIVGWTDFRNGSTPDVFAQRADSTAEPLWQPDGVAIAVAPQEQQAVAIAADGAGGAWVTWQDRRLVEPFDIHAARIDGSGTAVWTANGVAVCTAQGHQTAPRIVIAGAAGAIILWHDQRDLGEGLFAQFVDRNGQQ